MPSGLTADIYEGKPFKVDEYLVKVARQMTDFIHMRDEANSAKLTRRSWSTYEADALAKAESELARFTALTDKHARIEWRRSEEDRKKSADDSLAKNERLKRDYANALKEIEKVEFPEAISYAKEYAIKYIQESMEFDVSSDEQIKKYYTYEPISFEDWCEQKFEKINKDIEYYKKNAAESQARDAEFNKRIDEWSKVVGYKIV